MELVMVINKIIPLAASSTNRGVKVELPDQDLSLLGFDSLDRLVILTFILDLYEINDQMHDVPSFNTPFEIQNFVHSNSMIRFEDEDSLLVALNKTSGNPKLF
jgi:acyl carrier protein